MSTSRTQNKVSRNILHFQFVAAFSSNPFALRGAAKSFVQGDGFVSSKKNFSWRYSCRHGGVITVRFIGILGMDMYLPAVPFANALGTTAKAQFSLR